MPVERDGAAVAADAREQALLPCRGGDA